MEGGKRGQRAFPLNVGCVVPANKPQYPGTEIADYRKYIEALPLVDDPEIFGLHGNADLAYRSSQTKARITHT